MKKLLTMTSVTIGSFVMLIPLALPVAFFWVQFVGISFNEALFKSYIAVYLVCAVFIAITTMKEIKKH